MKKPLLLLCMACAFAAGAYADDTLRSVQQFLKEQGFYYGQVDGQAGSETTAAIRRFQIRGGLQVTGQLNQETLASMNLADAPAPPPPPAPEAAPRQNPAPDSGGVAESDKAFLKDQPSASAAGQQAPPDPAGYAALFRRTPYERAPREVQRSTVMRAQARLRREGFYRGQADGVSGEALQIALERYQAGADLPRTGRLDMETLADMDLLPRGRNVPDEEPPGMGRRIFRGIWVR
jgi:peptidoglycan hydrolase-like protein with peptidoglycan-binding domain